MSFYKVRAFKELGVRSTKLQIQDLVQFCNIHNYILLACEIGTDLKLETANCSISRK